MAIVPPATGGLPSAPTRAARYLCCISSVGADSISARIMVHRTNDLRAGENGFRPYKDACLNHSNLSNRQIRSLYSAIVLSDENTPEQAVLVIAMRSHFSRLP